jgi:hypothetical protein
VAVTERVEAAMTKAKEQPGRAGTLQRLCWCLLSMDQRELDTVVWRYKLGLSGQSAFDVAHRAAYYCEVKRISKIVDEVLRERTWKSEVEGEIK